MKYRLSIYLPYLLFKFCSLDGFSNQKAFFSVAKLMKPVSSLRS